MKRSDISADAVIAACADARRGRGPSLDLLLDRTGAPIKVALAAMDREVERGTIEYGVSIRYAWIVPRTEEGTNDAAIAGAAR